MNRILTIFRKDARHLWPQISIFWLLLALAAAFDPGRGDRSLSAHFSVLWFLDFALPLACWTLLIGLIHGERLPGDRQYWLTRPLTWKDLLTAKILFAAVFINLAVFAEQVIVIRRAGVPLWGNILTLLWRQVFFTAIYMMPVAAISAVTRNIGQVILGSLMVSVPFIMIQQLRGFAGNNLDWMGPSMLAFVLAAGVAVILTVQYSRRRTVLSRILIGVNLVVLVMVFRIVPREWPLALRSAFSGHKALESRLHVSLGQPLRHPDRFSNRFPGSVTVELPVRVDGIPAGTELIPEHGNTVLQATGESWNVRTDQVLLGPGGEGSLNLMVSRALFDQIKDVPLTASGSIEFALFGSRRNLPLPEAGGGLVPGAGYCFQTHTLALLETPRVIMACTTPFPRVSLHLEAADGHSNWIIPPGSVTAPIPTDFGFNIVDRYTSQLSYKDEREMQNLHLVTEQPIAHLRRTFKFRDIRIGSYAAAFSLR
jgi:hypothetical protein